jgi:hypothetical protein
VDSHYPVSPEAAFLIVGLKNVIGFGYSYAINRWQAVWGYERAFGCFAGLYFAALLLGVPLYLYGKKLRFASAKWKIIVW